MNMRRVIRWLMVIDILALIALVILVLCLVSGGCLW